MGNRAGEGRAYGNLGNAHQSLGDFSKAIAYHTQDLAIARGLGDRAGEGQTYGNLGCAHDSLGDFSQAIAYHTQDLAIAREVGDRAGEGRAGNNLGLALEKNGNLPAAARALVQGLAAFQRVERDLGAHNRRVSLFEQQQTTYKLLQGVLLGLEQPGWALGVAMQAKGRVLMPIKAGAERIVEYSFLFDDRLAIWMLTGTGELLGSTTVWTRPCKGEQGKEQRQNVRLPHNVPVPAKIQPGARIHFPWAQVRRRQ